MSRRRSSAGARAFAVAAAVAVLAAGAPLPAPAADQISQQEAAWEMQAGQQQFQQLVQQGKLLPQSPLYDELKPVADRVAAVAEPQYFAPFRFILVNERSPNAFAVPGGNVYVTTGLMRFAKNQDELAGVICHEVSHDIHHDVYNNNQKGQRLSGIAGLLGSALGMVNPLAGMAVDVGAAAQMYTFSRKVETNADRAGAYTCAQAGFNPWGMVWLFRRFNERPNQGRSMEMLSDHPRDDHRISDLENLFKSDPATFGKFADDERNSVPIERPQSVPSQGAAPERELPPPPPPPPPQQQQQPEPPPV